MAFPPTSQVIHHPFDPDQNRYFLHGVEVDEKTYRKATKSKIRKMIASNRGPGGHSSAGWPMYSDALAVTDDRQKRQLLARAKKEGVRIEFDRDDRIKLDSQGHRRDVCRLMGYTDRNAGYGDRVGDRLRTDRDQLRDNLEQLEKILGL